MEKSVSLWEEIERLQAERQRVFEKYKEARLAELGIKIGDLIQTCDEAKRVFKVTGWTSWQGNYISQDGEIIGTVMLKNGKFSSHPIRIRAKYKKVDGNGR